MRKFQGRVVIPGTVTAKAVVSRGGFNTLASYQKSLMFGSKDAVCGDQNNKDLYRQKLNGQALCLPRTIGSTTGGMVLYTAAKMGRNPACMLFSEPIDSLAAAGALLTDIWSDAKMPTVDSLGEEFLSYVQTGMVVRVEENGVVVVEDGKA